MFNAIRFLKAMVIFARHQAWVDQPIWQKDDAQALAKFMVSPSGLRLKAFLQNTVVRQQAHALNRKDGQGLVYEAGYCAGQKATVGVLEALADTDSFSDQGDMEADPDTTLAAS